MAVLLALVVASGASTFYQQLSKDDYRLLLENQTQRDASTLQAPRPLPATEMELLKRWLKTQITDAKVQIVLGKHVS